MNKVKSVITFVGNCSSISKKVSVILQILFTIMEFPAFLFHEIMHFLVVVPFGRNIEIVKYHFYTVEGNTLIPYQLMIRYGSTPLIGIVGSAAPMIGWILAVIISVMFGHWFIVLYLFFGFRMFFLSKEDIQAMKNNGFNERICDRLFKINKFLKPWQG